jgi:glycolate oxidase
MVTKVVVRLMRKPEAVKTVLAIYDSPADCGRTVSEITAEGITPVALEMMDGVMLRMAEEATHAGYPLDAAAVLLIEVEGLRESIEEQMRQIVAICRRSNARQVREAQSEAERALLWKGRKNAFGAIGRVSPFFLVQDGMVPRTKIPETLKYIGQVSEKYGLTISNIFHAGDGNMHPIILFDMRKPGDLEKAMRAGFDILEKCLEYGGSITGEHGIGIEKLQMMSKQFSPDSLEMMDRIKQLFDPLGLLNPGKVLPSRALQHKPAASAAAD